MTIQEPIETIDKEKQKRDFMHELTPAIAMFFRKRAGGISEVVRGAVPSTRNGKHSENKYTK